MHHERVQGTIARDGGDDVSMSRKRAQVWSVERLELAMLAILRAGNNELLARVEVPTATVITEYVDVANAFFDKREAGFVNGLLDAVSKDVRA